MERVKIRTKKGRIVTLDVRNKNNTHISGNDKYGYFTIIAIDDIDSMFSIGDRQ